MYFPTSVFGCIVALSRSRITFLFSLIILMVKLSQNILHNSYLHPGFKVRKINDFGNFLCTTNSVKALGLVEAPDCNWRFHFFSIGTNKKSYSYHLIRPLTTLSFSPLFGKTFRWKSFKKTFTSSTFHISFNSYPLRSSHNLSIHDSTVVSATSKESPDTRFLYKKTIFCQNLNFLNIMLEIGLRFS